MRQVAALATRIYDRNIRIVIDDLTPKQRDEAMAIVMRAYAAPASASQLRAGIKAGRICSCGAKRRARACN